MRYAKILNVSRCLGLFTQGQQALIKSFKVACF